MLLRSEKTKRLPNLATSKNLKRLVKKLIEPIVKKSGLTNRIHAACFE